MTTAPHWAGWQRTAPDVRPTRQPGLRRITAWSLRGADIRATASRLSAADHGDVDIDFTGFAGDCIIGGRFHLGSKRLTDELNQASTITLHDVVLDGLDGRRVTTPTFTIERSSCAPSSGGDRGAVEVAADRHRPSSPPGPDRAVRRARSLSRSARRRRACATSPRRRIRSCPLTDATIAYVRRRHPRGRGRLDAHRQPRDRFVVSRSRRRLRAGPAVHRPSISPGPHRRLTRKSSVGALAWTSPYARPPKRRPTPDASFMFRNSIMQIASATQTAIPLPHSSRRTHRQHVKSWDDRAP